MDATPDSTRAKRRIPPLDSVESLVIVFNLLLSQARMLVGGVLGSALAIGIATGDWAHAFLQFGWLHAIQDSLSALPTPETLAVACAVAALFTAGAYVSERRALSNEAGRASVRAGRRGLNGELPRLPFLVLILLMGLTGFAEELLFRFALAGIVVGLLTPTLPAFVAVPIALFVSSVAFWFAHVRYRDLATTALTLLLGLGLGIVFFASGSLAVAAIAHALYNLAVIVIARVQMRRDPDYFFGPAPTRFLLDSEEADGEGADGQKPDDQQTVG